MKISGLTSKYIAENTGSKVFSRGENLYRGGAVECPTQRDNIIYALVRGSEYEPYRIRIRLDDEAAVQEASCTCPYDWGGWCKHVTATLLTCLNAPDTVIERPGLTRILENVNREQLLDLLQALTDRQPELMDVIESLISQEVTDSGRPEDRLFHRPPATDPAIFYRQIKNIIRQYEGYWDDEPAIEEIRQLVEKAENFLIQDEAESALVILEGIIGAYTEEWMKLEGSSGGTLDLFGKLDDLLAEALLSSEPGRYSQEDKWLEQVTGWERAVKNHHPENGFRLSLAAIKQGWDDPHLKQILDGEKIPAEAANKNGFRHVNELLHIRLRILERQKRFPEYLRLAEAKGCIREWLSMLVKTGKQQEAIEWGMEHASDPDELLSLARALYDKGAAAEALRVAGYGLTVKTWDRADLAYWSMEVAENTGDMESALRAGKMLFEEYPDLELYQKLKTLAGETTWQEIREQCLARLRDEETHTDGETVRIFLQEGLLDEAIQAVERIVYDGEATALVMDAALEKRPEWVIVNARKRAEFIMNEGLSEKYDAAVNWLKRAKVAWLAAGRSHEWAEYLEEIKKKYYNEYKLMDLMDEL